MTESAATREARLGSALSALDQLAVVLDGSPWSEPVALYIPEAAALDDNELPVVCADDEAVPACSKEFRSPAALFVRDEEEPPNNVDTILPSNERLTAESTNPVFVVCATGLALAFGANKLDK